MEKMILYLNILSKWVITQDVTFIGYEKGVNSLFTVLNINDFDIHLEIFYEQDNMCLVNCYKDKNRILSFCDTIEDCLTEIEKIIYNNEV